MRGRPAFVLALACAAAQAEDATTPRVRFDASMLRNARNADVSAFETGNPVRAGLHDLEIWRNGEPLGRRSVRFAGEDAQPCFDAALLAWLGVAPAVALAVPSVACARIAAVHPAASVRHDAGELALHVSIPQALLASRTDALDPASFDAGLTAFRLVYGATVLHSQARALPAWQQGTLRLDAGMNAGAWRLRHRSTHAWRPARARESDTLATHLERDVLRFDARLTAGDFHASGLLLEPLALRGVRFQSDERLWPVSEQHEAPVIRGVADTNARVQVRQAGRLLFDTTVPPGPFALDGVRPLGRGGDLEVRIVEADGRVRTLLLPWAAMPGLLRAGRARFGLAAGRLRDAEAWEAPVVAGALETGVRDRLTVRAATQATTGHAQVLGGVALMARAGALSLDRVHARTARPDGLARGVATRAAFATDVTAARTSLEFSALHRPPTYHALQEVVAAPPSATLRERQRLDATLHATLGDRRHGVSLSFVERRFHAVRTHQRSAQLAWSMALGRNGTLLHATLEQSRERTHHAAHQAVFSVSVPLRIGETRAFAHAHARIDPGRLRLHSGIGGALGERSAWNLGVAHADDAHGATTTTSGALVHSGRAGRIEAGLSVAPGMQQASLSADGGLLVHPHGVTFGPSLGDTIALVRADHGAGARVLQAPHVRLDRRGRALVPHLSPYRRNRVGIDVRGASPDVAFDWTERDVVPRAGAVVDVPLASALRPTRFVRVVGPGGVAPVFGARLIDAAGELRALVGREGLARVPLDGLAWFLETAAHPCTIAHAGEDDLPVATCGRSGG